MQTRTKSETEIPENASFKLVANLRDEDNTWQPGYVLTTLILTLYDNATGNSIGGRNKQNVLNLNNVTVDAAGLVTYQGLPADSLFIGTGKKEWHIALFEFTWDSGNRGGSHEILFPVINRVKVL